MTVLIKILFEFTRFFKFQNIEFISIQAIWELITGCMFLQVDGPITEGGGGGGGERGEGAYKGRFTVSDKVKQNIRE